jgi:hypothetical protein
MNYENTELHNTVEIEPAAGGGVHLRRYPKAVRDCLSPLGRMVSQESAGCELRFVTEAESIRVAVSSLPSPLVPYELHNQDLFVFRGDFFPNGQTPQNAREPDDMQHKQEAFSQILRNTVADLRHPHLHLIEGSDILSDYSGMTKDLIHPGDYGHIEMGRNLATTIRKTIS